MRQLKLMDLKLINQAKYQDSNGIVWEYDSGKRQFVNKVLTSNLIQHYNVADFLDLRFEPYIDGTTWDSVPIDTKILVFNDRGDSFKSHFAGLCPITGKVQVWSSGRTSFTETVKCTYEHAELYKEGTK